jgi:dephospho-CoA kinase
MLISPTASSTSRSSDEAGVIAVGLTGGIGSGKSTVSALLAERGAIILDADQMSREVLEPGTEGLAQVVQRFGRESLHPDGSLNRPGLAAVVFKDSEALKDLNAIVHPGVGRLMTERLATYADTNDIVVLDVPLLFESGGRGRYPLAGVLVVDAPVETAVERVLASRPTTRQDVESRVAVQASRQERIAHGDYVILNIGSLEELALMVDRAWVWMLSLRDRPTDE